jgi:hypothetical protein
MYIDSTEDLRKKLTGIKYGGGSDDEKKEKYIAYHRDVYPVWIGYFERLYVNNINKSDCEGCVFIAGTRDPSFADFLMYDCIDTHRLLIAPALEFSSSYNPLAGVPNLEKWYMGMSARPRIRAYLDSDERRA